MLKTRVGKIARLVPAGLMAIASCLATGGTALANESVRTLVSTLHEHTRGSSWISAPTPDVGVFSPNGGEILQKLTVGSNRGGYDIHAVELMLRRPGECEDEDAKVEVELWRSLLLANGTKFVNSGSEPGGEFTIAKFVPRNGNPVRMENQQSTTLVVRTTSETGKCLGMAIIEDGEYENTSISDWSLRDAVELRKRNTSTFASPYAWPGRNLRVRISGTALTNFADVWRVEVRNDTGEAVTVTRNGTVYEADVGDSETIRVRAIPQDNKHATVAYYRNGDEEIVDENPATRGPETRVNPGRNVIDAVITAGDGKTQRRYKIVINRDDPGGDVDPSGFSNALRLNTGPGWTGMDVMGREWRWKTTLDAGETYRVEARGALDKSLKVYDEDGTRLGHETADGIDWATFTYQAQQDTRLLIAVENVSRIRVVASDTTTTTDEEILNRTDCNTNREGANNCAGAIGDSRTGTIDSNEDVDGWPIYVNRQETFDIAVYSVAGHALDETTLRVEDPAVERVVEETASNGRTIRTEVTAAPGSTRQIFIDVSGTPGESGAGRYALVVKKRVPYGLPRLRVTDATVEEGEGAVLEFEVRMRRAANRTVRVDYESQGGTATETVDFANVRGQLVFIPGEIVKTIEVPVFDDEHDEGSETMSLVLSNAVNADYEGRRGVGTITNTDVLPKDWAIRFGRTIARQASDAVKQRFASTGRNRVTIAGRTLGLGETGRGGATWKVEQAGAPDAARAMSWKDAIRASAFHLGSEGHGTAPDLSAWGRVSATKFEGSTSAGKVGGEVASAFIGADARWGEATIGLMASRSAADGRYRPRGKAEHGIEGRMDTLYPYAHMQISKRTSMWAMVGSGSGEITVETGDAMYETTDMDLRMGAANASHALPGRDSAGAPRVRIDADALWVETRTAKTQELDATRADATQLRLSATVGRRYELQGGAALNPSVTLALRSDHGDAETGRGLEAKTKLDIEAGRLSLSARTSILLTHSSEDYEEWGGSASLRYDATEHGKGLDFSLTPKWQATRSAADALNPLSSLDGVESASTTSVTAQIGHTTRLKNLKGAVRPHTGLTFADGAARSYKLGVQWSMSENASLGALATVGRSAGDDSEAALQVRANVRF